MDRATFSLRAETFGLDRGDSWAEEAFRLLFNAPRVYEPLLRAWDLHHPGAAAAMRRLVRAGWVAYQPAVVVDTRTGELAGRASRRVARYRTTAKGRRLLTAADEDLRLVEEVFPHTTGANLNRVLSLLSHLDLDGTHARWGLSAAHATELAGLAERSGRWWVARLAQGGYLRRLDAEVADVREAIPAHWRVTRRLCRQLLDVLDAFGGPTHWRSEFRLSRDRFLTDIDPARLGISGATDYDHDVETQRIVATLIASPRCAVEGRLVLEPRWNLQARRTGDTFTFAADGPSTIFYQPDAELVERDGTTLRRSIIEYERYQSRRDGWGHVERFLGWCQTTLLPFESAALRFVVDSPPRVRSYVQLIEAYADWCLDHPTTLPVNPVTLAVVAASDVATAADPLDPRIWHRISLPQGDGTGAPVLHDRAKSPYAEYFTQ